MINEEKYAIFDEEGYYYGIVNYPDKNGKPLVMRTKIKSICILTYKSQLPETIKCLRESIYGDLEFKKTTAID